MTNKSQSVINRKRLDQKVTVLEDHCLKMFKEVAWARDQDRHDVERLVEIVAGLERVGHLHDRVERLKLTLEVKRLNLANPPRPPWWKQLFRKENW